VALYPHFPNTPSWRVAQPKKKNTGTTLRKIHELKHSILNKEELPQQWKEFVLVPVCRNGDKIDCRNYRGISLLPTASKILSSILV
jgi:hypothetical protein